MSRPILIGTSTVIIAAVLCSAALAGGTEPADSPIVVSFYSIDDSITQQPIGESPRSSVSAAASFDLTYGLGLNSNQQAKDAFDRAADRWEALLNDPVTVKVTVDLASLDPGILGQTGSSMVYGGFDTVRDLVADAAEPGDAREAMLLDELPSSSQFSAHLPAGFSMDGSAWMTKANYRALGGSPTGSDGSITFSSNFNWDYDPTDGIDAGKYDFEGVAAHEMGHLLGFVSEVDYVDWMLNQGRTASDVWPRPLDLFRFDSADLTAGFDFTDTPRDLEPGGTHVFYHHDGSVLMSTGSYLGDGRQASHWKDNLGLGIMDPTAAAGEVLSILENDLIALDLIGWDIDLAPASLFGDVNGDGFVGGDDLQIISTNWGLSSATRLQGDLNADSFVGAADYNEVVSFWGSGTPPQPIPEPVGLGLWLAGGLFALIKRKRN